MLNNARLLPVIQIANKPRALATAADFVDDQVHEDGVAGRLNVSASYELVNYVYDVVA